MKENRQEPTLIGIQTEGEKIASGLELIASRLFLIEREMKKFRLLAEEHSSPRNDAKRSLKKRKK